MDKQSIIEKVDTISEEDVRFFVNGKEAESRFNYDDKTKERIQDSIETQVASALYSILINAIFLKTKGTQACNDSLPTIRGFISNYVRTDDINVKDNLEAEKRKAFMTIENFMLDREKITMAEILARLFPLVAIKFSQSDGEIDKKTFQNINKKKEVIFNQAILFSRCLFRSVLSMPEIDSLQIKSDLSAMDRPQFTYENILILPIYEDAFTLSSLKEAIKKAVSSTSNKLSVRDCDELVIVYLLRDFCAILKLQ